MTSAVYHIFIWLAPFAVHAAAAATIDPPPTTWYYSCFDAYPDCSEQVKNGSCLGMMKEENGNGIGFSLNLGISMLANCRHVTDHTHFETAFSSLFFFIVLGKVV